MVKQTPPPAQAQAQQSCLWHTMRTAVIFSWIMMILPLVILVLGAIIFLLQVIPYKVDTLLECSDQLLTFVWWIWVVGCAIIVSQSCLALACKDESKKSSVAFCSAFGALVMILVIIIVGLRIIVLIKSIPYNIAEFGPIALNLGFMSIVFFIISGLLLGCWLCVEEVDNTTKERMKREENDCEAQQISKPKRDRFPTDLVNLSKEDEEKWFNVVNIDGHEILQVKPEMWKAEPETGPPIFLPKVSYYPKDAFVRNKE